MPHDPQPDIQFILHSGPPTPSCNPIPDGVSSVSDRRPVRTCRKRAGAYVCTTSAMPRHLRWCHDERCWLACMLRLMAPRCRPEHGRYLTSTRHQFERSSKPGRPFSKGEFVYHPPTTTPIRHLSGDSGLQAEAWNTSASTRSKLSRKVSDSKTCWTRDIPNRVLSSSSMFTLTNILGSSEFGVWLEETHNILQLLD